MRCPHCKKTIKDEEALDAIAPAKILSRSGSIRGRRGEHKKKGHPSDVAARAARARWGK
jgi:hypothetical protein